MAESLTPTTNFNGVVKSGDWEPTITYYRQVRIICAFCGKAVHYEANTLLSGVGRPSWARKADSMSTGRKWRSAHDLARRTCKQNASA
jgi:hypothetical protein